MFDTIPTRTNTARSRYATYDRPVFFPGEGRSSLNVKPTAVTLFSGLGSSSLAMRRAGHRNVLAHDFMPEAVASLNANGFDAVQGDIREVDFTHPIYSEVKVLAGGPPCQPFSQGGRNAGENDPRDMIPDFQRAVAQILPEVFILENVRGLAGPRHRAYLDRRIAEFEALGYVVDHRVLDAADYGVAQNRKRLFVIGMRLDVADAKRFSGADILWPRKQATQTMAEALGWSAKDAAEANAATPNPGLTGAHSWVFARPSTTVVGSFRPEVQAAPGYRSTGDGPRQNAPGSVVTTQAERLILQGMPADWKVCGSKAKVDLQIGNSCPNPLLVSLLKANI